jgi:hypothetical protein
MKLMLDPVEYSSKPSKDEVKNEINGRIIRHQVDLTIQQLAKEIVKGKTFIPALIDKKVKGKVKRSIKSWSSQEIVCLDFDNEKTDPVTKEKYRCVEMTVEQALAEFKDCAAFIYKTFNYTNDHPKFRVVFVLDGVLQDYNTFTLLIESMLAKYPMADKSCKDGSRLFFGGIEYIDINYNNKLCISNWIGENWKSRAGDLSTLDTLLSKDIKGSKNPHDDEKVSNINAFSNLIDEYVNRELVEQDKYIDFHHLNDAYDYLYKQDIVEFLIENKILKNGSNPFKCVFHEDQSPSASIFNDTKTGNYMYKCHSSNCGFTGNLIRVVERLMKLKRVEAFKYLCGYYNVRLIETEWQKQQKEILDHNIYYLTSDTFKDEHPDLYKRIKRYLPMLVMLNLLAKQYIGTNTLREIEKNIFTASKTYISQMAKEFGNLIANTYEGQLEFLKINSDVKEIGKRVDLFAFLGVLEKIHINNIPKELYKIAVIEREKKLKVREDINFQNYYSIPEYGDQLMTDANQKAIEFKENNMSMVGFGREMLIRGMSKEEADKAYPMLNKVELSSHSNNVSEYIKKKFMMKIEQFGWVSESEIMDELIQENLRRTDGKEKGKNRNMKYVKRSLNELVEGYGLKRDRLNNKLKKMLNIGEELSGYPFVIYKL